LDSGIAGDWGIWRERAFVALLLLIFAALAVSSMRGKNPTFDETAHLSAGISYVQTGDFRMNSEHPILPKLLAGACASATGVRVTTGTAAWEESEQWDFGREVLYESGVDWRRILLAGRLPMVALGVLLGWVLWAWARAMVGSAAAAVALTLYTFSPNFLAHTRLVTTDVPLILTIVGASASLWMAWRTGRLGWTIGAAFCVGLSMVTKFSAFSYAPVYLLLLLTPSPRRSVRRSLVHLASFTLSAVIFTEILIFACYGFSFEWVTIRSLGMSGRGIDPGEMSWLRRIPFELMASIPWPSSDFAAGMKDIILFTAAGHPVFLLGMRADQGWWWSSFVTLAVKTPLPFLLLTLFASVVLARSRSLRRMDLLFVLAAPALVLATNVIARLGLGVRHLMPMFPFLMILAAWPLRGAGFRGGIYSLVLLAGFLIWHAAGSLGAHPHYLPYFNEAARAAGGGYRILGDSNLDWGQDLSAAAASLSRRGVDGAILCYFGTANPFVEGLDWQVLPPAQREKTRDPWTVLPTEGPQWLVMSATNRQGVYYRVPGGGEPYPWLEGVDPVEVIGRSIFLYEIGRNTKVQRGLADTYRRHGLLAEAEAALRRVVTKNPHDSGARRLLVSALLAKSDSTGAADIIGVSPNPDIDEILLYTTLRKRMGDFDEVERFFETALLVFRHDPEIKNSYAWFLQETERDLEMAHDLATEAVERAPEDPYFRDTRAMVLLKRGKHWEALEELDAALGKPGGNLPGILWHRILVLSALGRDEEANAQAELLLSREDLDESLQEEIAVWLYGLEH
jgi:tetratricopeptide (TPR) repeat protein